MGASILFGKHAGNKNKVEAAPLRQLTYDSCQLPAWPPPNVTHNGSSWRRRGGRRDDPLEQLIASCRDRLRKASGTSLKRRPLEGDLDLGANQNCVSLEIGPPQGLLEQGF